MSIPKLLPLSLALGLVVSLASTPLKAEPADAPPPPPPPRGDAPPRRGDGPMREQTPEERRQRTLGSYVEVLPDLTEAQKDQIMGVIDDTMKQVMALRADESLSPDDRGARMRQVRGEIPTKIVPFLTEAQRVTWQNALEEQRAFVEGTVGQMGELKVDESREEKRARISLGYEEILDELSIKQKTQVLAALGTADDAIQTAQSNAAFTDKQKQDSITKANADATVIVKAQLDAKQWVRWQKAEKDHDTKVKALPKPVAIRRGRGDD